MNRSGVMHTIQKGNKSFYIGDSELNPLAEITYYREDETTVTVDRTFVAEALRGQNIGRILLKELVDWVREENLKIIPHCSFVKAELTKNPDYIDVLKK